MFNGKNRQYLKRGLDSRFWLGNVALRLRSVRTNLPSTAGRGSEVENQKRGLGLRPFVEKLFFRNVEQRNEGKCAERLIKTDYSS